MYIGTIHGFCLDLLKSEVPAYLKYEVLNEVQQALFVNCPPRPRSRRSDGVSSGPRKKPRCGRGRVRRE